MKYLYAILFLICGLVPLVMEADGTMLTLMLIPVMTMIFSKKNWLGEPGTEDKEV